MPQHQEQQAFFDDMVDFYDRRSEAPDFRGREQNFVEIARSAMRAGEARRPLAVDLGCGPGAITLAVAALGYDVIGVDSAGAMVERARAHAAARPQLEGRCEFRNEEVDSFLAGFDGDADFIMSSSVFEYLANPADVVRLAAERLRPNGRLAISVPNSRSVVRRKDRLLRMARLRDRGYTKHWQNQFDADELIRVGRQLGLTPAHVAYFGAPPSHRVPFHPLAKRAHHRLVGTMTVVALAPPAAA
jgi:2-polyprenyl-3-methyl-5-hydroxy-6-metoxy-1,4-benzoquinol methylase